MTVPKSRLVFGVVLLGLAWATVGCVSTSTGMGTPSASEKMQIKIFVSDVGAEKPVEVYIDGQPPNPSQTTVRKMEGGSRVLIVSDLEPSAYIVSGHGRFQGIDRNIAKGVEQRYRGSTLVLLDFETADRETTSRKDASRS